MSSLNKSAYRQNVRAVTHAGTAVRAISNEKQLVRMTLANMLWENQFYVDGKQSAEIIADLVKKCDAKFVSNLAITARTQFKMRHVPLLLARELARDSRLAAHVLNAVIQRPDEMSEFLSIYWKDGKTPLANQVKKGLATAFAKFSEYSLAKWDKNSAAVKLRDVMFLVHPKPGSPEQTALFKRVADKTLATPDTWESELSAGADKRMTFTRLMAEKKLGALAFLRNLRNMVQAGVSEDVIRAYSVSLDVSKVLPFRYIAAARIMPQFEDMLEKMMLKSLESHEKLSGKTKLYVDVSSSMYTPKVSEKSDLTRQDASLALAMLCREICEDIEIYSFSGKALRIAPRHGFALAEAIKNSQSCSGTNLGKSLNETGSPADRIIVITDEQSYDVVGKPMFGAKGYMINVAAYQNGVNHGDWLTISGFSEAVIDYIQAVEKDVTF
jgi:60 kDa SS-A/Ro ribonucleoprotein